VAERARIVDMGCVWVIIEWVGQSVTNKRRVLEGLLRLGADQMIVSFGQGIIFCMNT
jgi:hypothetical protein